MRDKINSAMKQAMRDKEVLRLSTLRLVMAAIKDRDIAARIDGVDNSVSCLLYTSPSPRDRG